jgi:hypothetical protein
VAVTDGPRGGDGLAGLIGWLWDPPRPSGGGKDAVVQRVRRSIASTLGADSPEVAQPGGDLSVHGKPLHQPSLAESTEPESGAERELVVARRLGRQAEEAAGRSWRHPPQIQPDQPQAKPTHLRQMIMKGVAPIRARVQCTSARNLRHRPCKAVARGVPQSLLTAERLVNGRLGAADLCVGQISGSLQGAESSGQSLPRGSLGR